MIRIGPAGWAYKDWAGIVYPKPQPRGFSPVEYLSRLFDTLEINTSFYGPPKPETTQKWTEQVTGNKRFQFTAKLWRGFTHERNATAEDEKLVKDGFVPLVEARRLGALLMQFPMSFQNTAETLSSTSNFSCSQAESAGATTSAVALMRPPQTARAQARAAAASPGAAPARGR